MGGAHDFGLSSDHAWRTITPLARSAFARPREIFLIGDAARVVEPFTGEGIYYAMRSGELAAEAIDKYDSRGRSTIDSPRLRARACEELYHGRLWINRLASASVLWPRLGSLFVHVGANRSVDLEVTHSKDRHAE